MNDTGTDAPVTDRPMDRAQRMGLPPDYGDEQKVLAVRPALFRAKPFSTAGLLLLPLAVLAGMYFGGVNLSQTWAWATLVGLLAASILIIGVWYVSHSVAKSLLITNKRTVERRGLLSRSSDEVLHDHVRNINVKQSFIERVFNVGAIGIASAGQSGTEIEMNDLPNPDYIKEVIDAYRDALGSDGPSQRNDDGE